MLEPLTIKVCVIIFTKRRKLKETYTEQARITQNFLLFGDFSGRERGLMTQRISVENLT